MTLSGPLDTIPLTDCVFHERHTVSDFKGELSMPAQTGKRYTCPTCGSEFIVTKGGDGELTCGGTPLELKK